MLSNSWEGIISRVATRCCSPWCKTADASSPQLRLLIQQLASAQDRRPPRTTSTQEGPPTITTKAEVQPPPCNENPPTWATTSPSSKRPDSSLYSTNSLNPNLSSSSRKTLHQPQRQVPPMWPQPRRPSQLSCKVSARWSSHHTHPPKCEKWVGMTPASPVATSLKTRAQLVSQMPQLWILHPHSITNRVDSCDPQLRIQGLSIASYCLSNKPRRIHSPTTNRIRIINEKIYTYTLI